MAEVMLALGDFRFSVATAAYEALERTTEYRWVHHDRINRRPAAQFMGVGADTISLRGVIYPHYSGGLGQVDAMRSVAAGGQPLTLVDGLGVYHGTWCIVSVQERQSRHLGNSAPLKMEFDLSLAHYGEDG